MLTICTSLKCCRLIKGPQNQFFQKLLNTLNNGFPADSTEPVQQ